MRDLNGPTCALPAEVTHATHRLPDSVLRLRAGLTSGSVEFQTFHIFVLFAGDFAASLAPGHRVEVPSRGPVRQRLRCVLLLEEKRVSDKLPRPPVAVPLAVSSTRTKPPHALHEASFNSMRAAKLRIKKHAVTAGLWDPDPASPLGRGSVLADPPSVVPRTQSPP